LLVEPALAGKNSVVPEHTLMPGRKVIEFVAALGRTLGFVARTEFNVANGVGAPTPVDVAWFMHDNPLDRFPLFIVEVESSPTAGLAMNTLKVLGTPSHDLEKPLHYWHLVVSRGTESRRPALAQGHYREHNYTVYLLEEDGLVPFVLDVLAKVRRVHSELDLRDLIELLVSQRMALLDIDAILRHGETLQYRGNYVSAYANWALNDQSARPTLSRFARLLEVQPLPTWLDVSELHTYPTDWWYPVFLAAGSAANGIDTDGAFQALQRWQVPTPEGFRMVGPYLGLSMDYDDFVIGWVPQVWLILACLFRYNEQAIRYVLDQMWLVLDDLSDHRGWVVLPTAIAVANITAALGIQDRFASARGYINDRGGVSRGFLYGLPGALTVYAESFAWPEEIQSDPIQVPTIDKFVHESEEYRNSAPMVHDSYDDHGTSMIRNIQIPNADAIDLSLSLILEPVGAYYSGRVLLRELFRPSRILVPNVPVVQGDGSQADSHGTH